MSQPEHSDDYRRLLDDLKSRVRAAQVRASLAVNAELIVLYWSIGRDILARQEQAGWGTKVVDRLSQDLQRSFPDMKGLSTRNLRFMRAFAQAWPDEPILKQVVSQLPWGHNIRLLQKEKDPERRLWYARRAAAHSWSRDVLVLQIESDLYARQGAAQNNFDRTLPAPQSDLARQALKDPYVFDFLTLQDRALERDVEAALVHHIRDFLLELGVGFSFVGSQVHLDVGGQDFYLDMLFYHLHLRCFVVVELKTGAFTPEHAGKLNFYLSAVDDQLRHESDQPTIGILLCKSKNDIIVEYALRDVRKPIGVANWETRLVESLPDRFKGQLPTVDQMEAELRSQDD